MEDAMEENLLHGAMEDFPDGKASFAKNESLFFERVKKPEDMSITTTGIETDELKESRDRIKNKIDEIEKLLEEDKDEATYESNGPREKTKDEKKLEQLLLPDGWSVGIHPDFRLFISTTPHPDFPPNFARKCSKMALEWPQTVQRVSIRNYATLPGGVFTHKGNFSYSFRKIVLSLTLLHAVIIRRGQFGPFGWSDPSYEFAINDLEIGIR